jgi:hypothetical protein
VTIGEPVASTEGELYGIADRRSSIGDSLLIGEWGLLIAVTRRTCGGLPDPNQPSEITNQKPVEKSKIP